MVGVSRIPSIVIAAIISVLLFGMQDAAVADHQGPERVADGKYVVLLSLIPQENRETGEQEMKVRFLFRDTQTGKHLTVPLAASVTISDAESRAPVLERQMLSDYGMMELVTDFPRDGLYSIALAFEIEDGSRAAYRPEPWDVWVPGRERRSGPPFGLSEWLGLAMVGGLMVLIALSLLRHRKRKSSVEGNL